jgi:hypothetical protein
MPFSKLTGIRAYNSPVSYNRLALLVGGLGRVVQLIGRRTNSVDWANERRKHLWLRILEKAKPRCVVGIQPDVGLCRAAKTKDLPILDLQHGVIADKSPLYGEKYRIAASSWDLPTGYLCWDEPSAAVLRKWAARKGIDVRVVGNPWFSRFLFNDLNDSMVQEALKAGRIFNNHRPVILVSLQARLKAHYYKHTSFNGIMVDALEKTILQTADTYNWLLRLHPCQMRGTEMETTHEYLWKTFGHLTSVEWTLCSELPLPVVLQQASLHITDMSTVVVEAGWMGVFSGLLNDNIRSGGILENIYEHERSLGLATVLPQDTNTIRQWIAQTLTRGKGHSSFKDAHKAMHAFLNDIAVSAERNDTNCSSRRLK